MSEGTSKRKRKRKRKSRRGLRELAFFEEFAADAFQDVVFPYYVLFAAVGQDGAVLDNVDDAAAGQFIVRGYFFKRYVFVHSALFRE